LPHQRLPQPANNRRFASDRRSQARRGCPRVIEKVAQDACEQFRLLVMDVVPGTREYSEDGTLDSICESFAVSDGNQPVAVSPAHQDRRKSSDFVSALHEQTALAPPVDDVANASSERPRRSLFGVDRAELGDFRLRLVRLRSTLEVCALRVPLRVDAPP